MIPIKESSRALAKTPVRYAVRHTNFSGVNVV